MKGVSHGINDAHTNDFRVVLVGTRTHHPILVRQARAGGPRKSSKQHELPLLLLQGRGYQLFVLGIARSSIDAS